MPFIALALVVAAALGGGTAVAAQNALPGDALWGFKTEVNERFQETFAQGDKAKAEIEIALIKARLEDAQKLHAQGKLDTSTQTQLSNNFDAHARDIADRIAKLQTNGSYTDAATVATQFQAAIAAEASALAELNAKSTGSAHVTIGGILQEVQAALKTASGLSAHASAEAQAHADVHAGGAIDHSLNGEASSSNSGNNDEGMEDGVQVQTGTSVQSGTGGIKVDSETGTQIGI